MLRQADALILPGSSDPAYSPSKLYPYYLSGKPILGVVFENSHLQELLTEFACAWLVSFSPAGANDAAYSRLGEFFDHALSGFPAGVLPPRNDTVFRESYLAEPLTEAQCEFFNAILTRQAAPHRRD